MNNEIKEILDNIKKCCDITKDQSFTVYQRQDILKLLDYITNLQEENERLKEENKRIFSKVNDDELLISNAMNYAEAQDYKSRCEKALDKLYCYGEVFDSKILQEFQKEMENILNGDDKSE